MQTFEYSFVHRNNIVCETEAETLTEALENIGITSFKVEYEFYHMAVITQINPGNIRLQTTFGVFWNSTD